MSNGYEDRTHCKNGHEYNEENTRYAKDRRVCRVCKREQKARDRRDPEVGARRREYDRLWRQSVRGNGLEGNRDVARYDDKKTAVQRILAPKPEAMPTWERMWEHMDANRTPCFERPEDFIDYDDPRYPDEATGRPMPTAFEARQMCAPCPLLELCGKFAAQNKEAAGVWGGMRFIDGKRWNG